MTTTQQPTFDYGEPWGFDGENWITDARNKKILNLDSIHSRNARRLIDCVNACQKMAEPAAEIQAMREAIREAHTELSTLLDTINNSRGVDGWHLNGDIATWDEFEINPAATITKLQPFIKLTHTPHEQQGQQQTQHDVWLREKLKAMVKPIKEAYNPFPDKPFIL